MDVYILGGMFSFQCIILTSYDTQDKLWHKHSACEKISEFYTNDFKSLQSALILLVGFQECASPTTSESLAKCRNVSYTGSISQYVAFFFYET